MFKLGTTALFAIGVAACSAYSADDSNIMIDDSVNAAEAANAEVEVLPPSEFAGNAADNADPNQPVHEGNEKAVIPLSMQGRWGMNANDCHPKRSDAKGLLRVSADTLLFYESVATVKRVTFNAPENFTADFAFTGEGMEWTKSENLKLTNSSNTLVRSDDEGSYRYIRCP